MAMRRQFSREFKARVVLDVLTGVQSQAEVCRKHTLGANLLGLWKSTLPKAGAPGLRQRGGALGRAGADRRSGAGAGAHDPGERDLKRVQTIWLQPKLDRLPFLFKNAGFFS
jgi:transposase-like protein